MNKYSYISDGIKYIRVSKAKARKHYNTNAGIIAFCPCNLNPGSQWGVVSYITPWERENGETFDKLVNAFEFYNCTNNETGKRAAFYIADNETLVDIKTMFRFGRMTKCEKQVIEFLNNEYTFCGTFTELTAALDRNVTDISNVRKTVLGLEKRNIIHITQYNNEDFKIFSLCDDWEKRL